MTINIGILIMLIGVALFLGIWIGKSTERMAIETERQAIGGLAEAENDEEKGKGDGKVQEAAEPKHRPGEAVPTDAIGSPAAGAVTYFHEGRKRGVCIKPEQGRVYAPVSGKVKKMYPMGNAMLIVSDKGEEILIRVCEGVDEIYSMYFRARVVQNEMINKGKLLLEFDKEGLEAVGVEVTVSVSAEARDGRIFAMTSCNPVKAGEALLWA